LKKNEKRTGFSIIFAVILALAFFLAVPVVPASAPGAVNICGLNNACIEPMLHFKQSLDCYLLGARPGQWIGVYYFGGELGIGCGPMEYDQRASSDKTINQESAKNSSEWGMKARRKAVVAVALASIVAFLFLAPVIGYATPSGAYNCPANGCNFLRYGSVTYWGLGVGGTWRDVTGYSVSVAPASTVIISSSSMSYTVSAEPTHTVTSVTDTENSLQLQLYLNASSSPATGVSVGVFVDEYNPLASTNNVTAASHWMAALNGDNGAPCWIDSFTVGFAIAQGYYTSSNVTAAKLLDLVNPGATYNCPLYLGYANPTGFLFKPMSDTAASYGCIGESPCPTGSASSGLTSSSWGAVTGYWTMGGAFTSFPRGVYTVLAEDEWGNSALAYFTVS
jgi:hypothetical protein